MTYIFRWDRCGRKGQPCQVTARSLRTKPVPPLPIVAFGWPAPKNFNSIALRFADGFEMVTSGNSIRRADPAALHACDVVESYVNKAFGL